MKKWLTALTVLFLAGLFSMSVYAKEKTTAALETDVMQEQKEVVLELIGRIKEKAAAGELESEEDVRTAIKEGEEELGASLTEEETERITGVISKLKEMGFDSEEIIGQAEKLYNKYGADIVNHADEAVTEAVGSAVSNAADGFFASIKESVQGFFGGLFKK